MSSFIEFHDEEELQNREPHSQNNHQQQQNNNNNNNLDNYLQQKILKTQHNSISHKDTHNQDIQKQNLKNDKINLLFLGVLYLFQGLIIGFTEGSVPVILIQNGAKFSQLGLLSLTSYPWSFQMLAAPIFDTYYSNSFGKRKTYLVPLQICSALILLASSFNIDSYIDNHNVFMLFLLGLILEWIYSVQDITVGGWALTLLSPENVPLASTCQNIGQTTGVTIAFNVYIWLNSPKFLNEVLGTQLENPILTPKSFFILAGLLIFSFTTYFAFFKPEKREEVKKNSQKDSKSLFTTLKKFKGFYQNENLKYFIAFLLLYPLTTAPVDGLSDLILLKEGLSREYLSTIELILIPAQFIASIFTAIIVKKKKEFTGFLVSMGLNFLNNIFKFYITMSYKKGVNDEQILELLFINYMINTACNTLQFICSQSFSYRMCDKSLGASYLTMMNSLSNFGGTWASSLVLFLADYVSMEKQYIVSIFLFFIFWSYYYKKLLRFEKTSPEDWKLAQPVKEQENNDNGDQTNEDLQNQQNNKNAQNNI